MPSSNRPKRDDDDGAADTTNDLPAATRAPKNDSNDRSRAVTNRMDRAEVEKREGARPADGQRVRSLRGSTVIPPRTPRETEGPDDAAAERALAETEDHRPDGLG